MAITRLNQLPEGSGSLTNDDIFVFMDDPSGSKVTKKISLSQIADAIGGGGISGVVQDTNPQLGGNLDLNSNNIIGSGNINIVGSGVISTLKINNFYHQNLAIATGIADNDLLITIVDPTGSPSTEVIQGSVLRSSLLNQPAQLQFKQGTEAERLLITPASGEPIWTTDSQKLYIGDGITVGGDLIGPGLHGRGQGTQSVVVFNDNCVASGNYSTVIGGQNNRATGFNNVVCGGFSNTSTNTGSTVVGGIGNTSSGFGSTVGGGYQNTSSGSYSIVGGGGGGFMGGNTASGTSSTVGGGRQNTSSSSYSTVAGGKFNVANNSSDTVGGGNSNTSAGSYSTVPGGFRAKATRYGELSHAAGLFANTGDAQHTILIARRTTTNATANQVLFLNGSSARLTLPAETTWTFTIKLSAYNDTDNESGWWIFTGGIRRNAANNTALIGSLITESGTESSLSTASASVVADDTNEALEIRVTGVASKNIRWVAVVDISQVSYGTP